MSGVPEEFGLARRLGWTEAALTVLGVLAPATLPVGVGVGLASGEADGEGLADALGDDEVLGLGLGLPPSSVTLSSFTW